MTRTLEIALMLGAAALIACGTGQDPSTPTTSDSTSTDQTQTARGDAGVSGTDGSPSQATSSTAAGQPAEPQPVERPSNLSWNDPRAIATEALNRCKGRDLRAVMAVSTDRNQRHRVELGENSSAGQAIFGATSWRARALQDWTGAVTSARASHDEARVRFADLEGEEVAVVVLMREENQWRFHDIRSHGRQAFEDWGREL